MVDTIFLDIKQYLVQNVKFKKMSRKLFTAEMLSCAEVSMKTICLRGLLEMEIYFLGK